MSAKDQGSPGPSMPHPPSWRVDRELFGSCARVKRAVGIGRRNRLGTFGPSGGSPAAVRLADHRARSGGPDGWPSGGERYPGSTRRAAICQKGRTRGRRGGSEPGPVSRCRVERRHRTDSVERRFNDRPGYAYGCFKFVTRGQKAARARLETRAQSSLSLTVPQGASPKPKGAKPW